MGQLFLKDARRLILSWGYVQDERYAAGAGRAGAACVSFAQHFATRDSMALCNSFFLFYKALLVSHQSKGDTRHKDVTSESW